MVWIDDALYCDGCGVEIYWAPEINKERHYCCKDCADSRACACGERLEMEDDQRAGRSPADAGYSAGA